MPTRRNRHTALAAKRTAIGEYLGRTDAAAQPGEVQKLSLQRRRRQFKQDVALLLVPVIRKEAIVPLQSSGSSSQLDPASAGFVEV